MSTRSQVYMKNEGIYLYQHMDGSYLAETVQTALSKKWRWDDPEYLTRIIFCEMIKGQEDKETGYGIGTEQHGDIEYLVTVDTEKQTVIIQSGYGKLMEIFKGSFEDFIKSPLEIEN